MARDADATARAAIVELLQAYASGADRKRYDAVASLFTPDGRLAVYRGDPGSSEPRTDVRGHEQIARELAVLAQFEATTHFLGQHRLELRADEARGETYCLAHHVYSSTHEKRITVMSIRYIDHFIEADGEWRFKERLLAVDWVEDRPLKIAGSPS